MFLLKDPCLTHVDNLGSSDQPLSEASSDNGALWNINRRASLRGLSGKTLGVQHLQGLTPEMRASGGGSGRREEVARAIVATGEVDPPIGVGAGQRGLAA